MAELSTRTGRRFLRPARCRCRSRRARLQWGRSFRSREVPPRLSFCLAPWTGSRESDLSRDRGAKRGGEGESLDTPSLALTDGRLVKHVAPWLEKKKGQVPPNSRCQGAGGQEDLTRRVLQRPAATCTQRPYYNCDANCRGRGGWRGTGRQAKLASSSCVSGAQPLHPSLYPWVVSDRPVPMNSMRPADPAYTMDGWTHRYTCVAGWETRCQTFSDCCRPSHPPPREWVSSVPSRYCVGARVDGWMGC